MLFIISSSISAIVLVQGLCFFAGGIQFSEQGFDPSEFVGFCGCHWIRCSGHVYLAATQIHSSLLSLSVGVVLLPAAYHFTLGNPGDAPFEAQKKDILHMSHGVSNL